MKESNENQYDVIIIGAGLAGLTVAALLAKAGRKVLLVEKEKEVGGYFGPLMQGDSYFNNGPRLLMGCNADGPFGPGVIYSLLSELGVQERCEFIRLQPFTAVRMPGLEYQLWSGREAFIHGLESAHPGGFENLPRLFDVCASIQQAGIGYHKIKWPWEFLKMAGVARYQFATAEDVLKSYIPDARARTMAGVLWAYLGLTPEQASFIFWSVLTISYVDEGAYFCKGGLHQLPRAIAYAFTRDGGELLTGTSVTRVRVENGIVRGVELSDGRKFFAPNVVANIDPRLVFGKMIETEERPSSYLKKLNRMELSIRGISLLMKTDLDLPRMGFGYETLTLDHWDADKANIFSLTVMDAADPDLAPRGQHLVSLYTALPPDYVSTPEADQHAAMKLLDMAETHAPGLKDHLLWKQSGENPDGFATQIYEPIYGWASLPRYAGLMRLSLSTPIHGLTLTGQWTCPGQGATGVTLSGLDAAGRLLR